MFILRFLSLFWAGIALLSTLSHAMIRLTSLHSISSIQLQNILNSRTDMFYQEVGRLESLSNKIKCPFFRRRATDLIDGAVMIMEFALNRHKSLGFVPLPRTQLSRPANKKILDLSIEEIARKIEGDWLCRGSKLANSGKGYYITGNLSTPIYSDDCFFDGPDPDMPVRRLDRYLSAASHLFDRKVSRADLSSLLIDAERRQIKVHWRIEGVLNLPWHPKIKPWTGSTTYHLGDNNLIERHVETWDISVLDAFVSMLLPQLNIGAPPAPPSPAYIPLAAV